MRTIIALLLATTAVSHAQPPDAAPQVTAAAAKSSERLTVMWAPIRLVVPLVEITGELRVRDHLGAVLILGGGKRDLESNGMTISGTELEVGAQLRYYPMHAFSGLHVGGEVLDEYVRFEEPLPPGVVGVAAGGVTAGAFAGYKMLRASGFTFEAQAGARYLVIDPPFTGMIPAMPPSGSRWLPVLHLNVGWSF